MSKRIKAYKMFNNDWTCRGFKYEIGKTYTHEGDIEICDAGFHTCKRLQDCFEYYPCVPWQRIAEVELIGNVKGLDGDKQVTDEIKIVKEIPFEKIGEIIKDDLVNESYGVNESNGVNGSQGVNESDGVNWSYGVNRSDGVNRSYGVNRSFGILKCRGISNSLFSAGLNNQFFIFNQKVKEARFNEIIDKLYNLLNGWQPTYNNLKSLYIKSGNEWKRTPIPDAKELQKEEAWEGMPKEAIDYLKELPEFNSKIFTDITGIKI